MLQTIKSCNNMMVSPHWMATQAGIDIMRNGGNAIEAMISSAAVISVVYPHMNSLGGDNFWLINDFNNKVIGIEATGYSGEKATIDYYLSKNLNKIPTRGTLSALTVPGVVSGWQRAYNYSKTFLNGSKSLSEIFDAAIQIANSGFPVTKTLEKNLIQKKGELFNLKEFSNKYYSYDYKEGEILKFPEMATTFNLLIKNGLNDFYRGSILKKIMSDLKNTDCLLSERDFVEFNSQFVNPLKIKLENCSIFNLPPPTQGVASLLLLGILDQLKEKNNSQFEFIHSVVEATKKALLKRDMYITDPTYMKINVNKLIDTKMFKDLAQEISFEKADDWPFETSKGDTVWLGAVDSFGNSVSFIQSIFWEFGSGIFLPETGITLQNRGSSFSLNKSNNNSLSPRRKPFHTIQPALAKFNNGDVLVYGTMGGDGQPQTQAIIFSRLNYFKENLQDAINKPRWLLGKTWGSDVHNLRLENRFDPIVINELKKVGHKVELVEEFNEIMGHSGAILSHLNGIKEGAFDYRSDGMAIGS